MRGARLAGAGRMIGAVAAFDMRVFGASDF
jgi:hypothetical protein